MSFTQNLRIPRRHPCDYSEAYLDKIADISQRLKNSFDPKRIKDFLPLLSALSNYIESGRIMLIYKNMPQEEAHYFRFQEINRENALKMNEELARLQHIFSHDQILLCNEIAKTILFGY